MMVELEDRAKVQPVVECMCPITLNAYTRSNKNEANKANEVKSD